MQDLINNYLEKLKKTIDKLDKAEIENFLKVLIHAKENGNTIFVMGNGGSASTASHFVCDIAKGVSYGKDKKFKVISLNDNYPMMMAYANDVGYEEVFVEQLKNLFSKGDVVIGFSGSGNSKNVLKAIDYANANGGVTVGVTGYVDGKLKKVAKHSVNANIDDIQVAEDIHTILLHIVMQVLNKLDES